MALYKLRKKAIKPASHHPLTTCNPTLSGISNRDESREKKLKALEKELRVTTGQLRESRDQTETAMDRVRKLEEELAQRPALSPSITPTTMERDPSALEEERQKLQRRVEDLEALNSELQRRHAIEKWPTTIVLSMH